MTLDKVAAASTADRAFLLMPLAPVNQAGLREAMEAANDFALPARICFVIDRSTLDDLDSRWLEQPRVGLVLGDVDASTPLSELIRDPLEAIRFDAAFVWRASSSLRFEAALRAILGLAQNLGLGTLGPALPHRHSPRFDYELEVEQGTAATDTFVQCGRQPL